MKLRITNVDQDGARVIVDAAEATPAPDDDERCRQCGGDKNAHMAPDGGGCSGDFRPSADDEIEDKRDDARLLTYYEQKAVLTVFRREAFDAGAKAMQHRIAQGIARWWSAAPAGQRHPGHPHHLEAKARAVKVEDLDGRP